MTSRSETSNVPALVNDPLAPDIFADEAAGFYLAGGNLRITFATWRVGHEETQGTTSRVAICRLVMPVSQAEAMVKGLSDFLQQMRAPPH